jgi:hypothetical protein
MCIQLLVNAGRGAMDEDRKDDGTSLSPRGMGGGDVQPDVIVTRTDSDGNVTVDVVQTKDSSAGVSRFQRRIRRAFYVHRPLLQVTLKIYALYGVWTMMEVFAIGREPDSIKVISAATVLGVIYIFRKRIQKALPKARASQRVQHKYPKLSIVGIVTQNGKEAETLAALLLIIFGAWLDQLSPAVPFAARLLLCFMGLAILARGWLVQYRVRKGFYGRTEAEAREILQFVLDHTKDTDFTDGGKPKKVISPQDLEEIQARVQGVLAGSAGQA